MLTIHIRICYIKNTDDTYMIKEHFELIWK
jgi:hypothetical protein